ncbi:RNA polymerase subunit sigma-70, partial [Desulfosporosinus sp.]|uniref:RNA polymerase subunit sigma-70 n=1 Tax=Desulfosporosinus sp. TaxID=157907 RepID=UPI0025C626B9
KKIFELRGQGFGYKAIAGELSLSSDTVKSFCKRHHLNGHRDVVSLNIQVMEKKNWICPQCNKPIKQKARGRNRRFCSDKCRRKWWNDNPQDRNRKETAIYSYTCKHCGKEFSSYGNKRRKYCSHDCYIKSRFWEEDDVT